MQAKEKIKLDEVQLLYDNDHLFTGPQCNPKTQITRPMNTKGEQG